MDMNKHIWEGWTVQQFVDELEPMFKMIMRGQSWKKPFQTKEELTALPSGMVGAVPTEKTFQLLAVGV